MDPLKQIAALKKQLADSIAFGKLSDAEKTHYASLDQQDAAAFLAKSASDRKVDISKAAEADPVMYTCDDGTIIRKSDGQIAERQARKYDELNAKYAKQAEATEQMTFEKRAGSIMKHYPKTLKAKALVVRAIEKATESTDKDGKLVVNVELRKEAMDILKAGDTALSKSFSRFGKSNTETSEDDAGGDGDPEVELDRLAKAHAKENKISYVKAYAAVLDTEAGQELYASIDGGSSGAVDDPGNDDYDDDGGDVEVVEDGFADKK